MLLNTGSVLCYEDHMYYTVTERPQIGEATTPQDQSRAVLR